jgi:hypothetical protein
MSMAKLSERVVKTKELLKEHLLLDVVEEIIKYTLPLKDDDYHIGLVGNFELCLEVKNVNECLYGACNGGHMEIVKYLESKGANDWNNGLYFACEGGQMEIMKYMIEKGANKCENCDKPIQEHQ